MGFEKTLITGITTAEYETRTSPIPKSAGLLTLIQQLLLLKQEDFISFKKYIT